MAAQAGSTTRRLTDCRGRLAGWPRPGADGDRLFPHELYPTSPSNRLGVSTTCGAERRCRAAGTSPPGAGARAARRRPEGASSGLRRSTPTEFSARRWVGRQFHGVGAAAISPSSASAASCQGWLSGSEPARDQHGCGEAGNRDSGRAPRSLTAYPRRPGSRRRRAGSSTTLAITAAPKAPPTAAGRLGVHPMATAVPVRRHRRHDHAGEASRRPSRCRAPCSAVAYQDLPRLRLCEIASTGTRWAVARTPMEVTTRSPDAR